MFTGLVECTGEVVELVRREGVGRLEVTSTLPAEGTAEGASIAVDGVCLTVVRRETGRFWFDAIPETLSRTTLGRLRAGDRVNLERPLRLGDRLGGHWVQGHVDGTATVRESIDRGGDWRLRIDLPPELRRYVAEKGSVALDGVSLTVARVTPEGLEVALIPETLRRTTLGGRGAGDQVNVEVDLLARYLERLNQFPSAEGGGARSESR